MAVAATPFDLIHIVDALKELTLEQTKTLFFNITGSPPPELLTKRKTVGKGLVIGHWLDLDVNASWEKICSGLKQMKLNVLAKKIDSQYCTLPQVPPSSTNSLSTDSTVCESHQSAETIQLQSGQTPDSTAEKVNSQPCGSQSVSVEQPTDHTVMEQPTHHRVVEVKEAILMFEEKFSMIQYEMRQSLCEMEKHDREFLERFRDYLLFMPLLHKGTHAKFFHDSEDEISEAKNIRKMLAILSRYCNHSNYDIILMIIKKFCDNKLKKQMSNYCQEFEEFEKSTTIDIYCLAISASNALSRSFREMTTRIKKPATTCTLHDVRWLSKEKPSLHSYSVYIDSVAES